MFGAHHIDVAVHGLGWSSRHPRFYYCQKGLQLPGWGGEPCQCLAHREPLCEPSVPPCRIAAALLHRGETQLVNRKGTCYIFLLCAHVQLHMPQPPHVLRTALRVIRLKRSALYLLQLFNFCPKKKNRSRMRTPAQVVPFHSALVRGRGGDRLLALTPHAQSHRSLKSRLSYS